MFFISTCLTIGYGQKVEITNVKLKGDDIEVHYNLLDERIDRSYSINLFTSKDNFIQSMDIVRGDIGIDIPVDFDGALSLALKGNY